MTGPVLDGSDCCSNRSPHALRFLHSELTHIGGRALRDSKGSGAMNGD